MLLVRILVQSLLFLSATYALKPPTQAGTAAKGIPIAPNRSSLQKRAQFTITGNPTDDQRKELEGLITSCRDTARNIVDRVQANNAIFLSFFGGPDFYQDIMRVFRRIAQIGEDTPDGDAFSHQVVFNFANAQPEPNVDAAYQFQNPGGSPQPIIYLYDNYTNRPTIAMEQPVPNLPNFLGHIAAFRWTTVMHELVHYASDPNVFRGPVLDVTLLGEGEDERWENRIIDMPIDRAASFSAHDRTLANNAANYADPRGYGPDAALLLPRLEHGPLVAALNAENYAIFAAAVLFGWSPTAHATQVNVASMTADTVDYSNPFTGRAAAFIGISIVQTFLRYMGWIRLPGSFAPGLPKPGLPKPPLMKRGAGSLATIPVTFD